MKESRRVGRIAQGLLALGVLSCIEVAAPLSPAAAEPLDPDPVPEATPADATSYTVRPGDTLWVLARRFDVSAQALARRNGIGNARRLRVGSVLEIPSPSPSTADAPARDLGPNVHVVRPGDSLYSLARLYGVRVGELRAMNAIEDPRRLQLGQRLRLPIEPRREPASDPPARAKPLDAAPAVAVERADEILAEIEDDYLRADFEGVLERVPELDRLLDSLAAYPEEFRQHRARAAFVAGASLAGLGRKQEAVASFERAYQAHPDLEPDPALTSPHLAELLDAARGAGATAPSTP
jgi:LysM repeat protein